MMESYTESKCWARRLNLGLFILLIAPLMFLGLSTGCGSDDSTGSQIIAPQPVLPTGPGNLSVVPDSGNLGPSVNMSWDPVPGDVVEIVIDRREQINGAALSSTSSGLAPLWSEWLEIAALDPDATSFSDTSPGCGRQTEYRVCTNSTNNGRNCSPPIQASIPLCPPRDLTASLSAGGAVDLSWTDNSSDESIFKIYRKTAPSGPWSAIDYVAADSTSYTDNNAVCGVKHLYKVQAINLDWHSGFSNEASVYTDICAPGPGCGVLFVDDDATGAGTGATWADAFTHPQDAVDAANSCDVIWVAEGNYLSGTTAPVVTMKDGVEIYGGFTATENNIDQRGDPAAAPSVLDGETISYHVVLGASDARLDGFTVTGGNGNGGSWDNWGGGMLIRGVINIDIADCLFTNNASTMDGGGIYVNNSVNVNVVSSSFKLNSTAATGGGIANTLSTVAISNCYLDSNTAAQWAGGVNVLSSSVAIDNCIFINNFADTGGGGGISSGSVDSTFTYFSVTNCLLANNSTNAVGGGLFTWHSYPTVTNCTFYGNSADRAGAFWSDGPSYSTVTNTITWGNSARLYNEIRDQWGSVTVTYSDIQGGYAGFGNIDLDPLFFDPAGNDHSLQAGSPAIDAGDPSAVYNDPDGSRNDMGAYPF